MDTLPRLQAPEPCSGPNCLQQFTSANTSSARDQALSDIADLLAIASSRSRWRAATAKTVCQPRLGDEADELLISALSCNGTKRGAS